MGWFTGIILYLMIWWITIFAVLPWGLQRDSDGTPKNPKLLQKLILTSVISTGIWVLIYILIDINIINFREMALDIAKEHAL